MHSLIVFSFMSESIFSNTLHPTTLFNRYGQLIKQQIIDRIY